MPLYIVKKNNNNNNGDKLFWGHYSWGKKTIVINLFWKKIYSSSGKKI